MENGLEDATFADTLRYQTQVQRFVSQNDLKITVKVTALVSTQDTGIRTSLANR